MHLILCSFIISTTDAPPLESKDKNLVYLVHSVSQESANCLSDILDIQ